MTNIIATLIVTATTNWLDAPLADGTKQQVGVIVRDHYAQIVWDGGTNKSLLKSEIVGQLNVRKAEETFIFGSGTLLTNMLDVTK